VKKVWISCLSLLTAALLSLLLFAASDGEAASITSVQINEEQTHLVINATLDEQIVKEYKSKLVYLFALSPGQSAAQLSSLTPIATQTVRDSLSFRLYLSDRSTDRLFARYQLAVKQEDESYLPLGQGRYLDDPAALASITTPIPHVSTKKGLQTQLYADAQILGSAHTIVTVPLNELLATKQTDYAFVYCAKTYYLDPTQMDLLDYKVRRLSQAGVRVYLDLVLTAPGKDRDKGVSPVDPKELYISTDSPVAQFFAFNTKSEEACHYLQGLLRYLSARYTRPDRQYGFAASYLIGYEVNSNRFRHYRGSCTLTEYAASYAELIRLVHTATRSVYAASAIYVPLANNWTVPSIDPTVTPDALLDYSASEFLAAFNAAISAQGDPIDWSVAINPYPSDLTRSDFWNDEGAEDSLETPYMTMKNLHLLTALLSSSPYAKDGKARTVLVSEFGVSGEIDTESEAMQAAALVWAYYKVLSLPTVEAMIWHRQVDRIGENDLYFGLWSSDYSDILSPVEKKQSYEVFRTIDTKLCSNSQSGDVTAFAAPLIGVSSLSELFPTLTDEQIVSRHVYEAVITQPTVQESHLNRTTVCDFSADAFYTFYPSDSVRYLEKAEDDTFGSVLKAVLFRTDSVEYAGIASYGQTGFHIRGQDYLRLVLTASHGGSDEKVSLLIRLSGTDADGIPCTYEGIGTIDPGVWSTVNLPIADFASRVESIDSMRIWIRGHQDRQIDGDCAMSLASVSLLSISRFSTLELLIRITLGGAILVLISLGCYVTYVLYSGRQRKRTRLSHRLSGRHRFHYHRDRSDADETKE